MFRSQSQPYLSIILPVRDFSSVLLLRPFRLNSLTKSGYVRAKTRWNVHKQRGLEKETFYTRPLFNKLIVYIKHCLENLVLGKLIKVTRREGNDNGMKGKLVWIWLNCFQAGSCEERIRLSLSMPWKYVEEVVAQTHSFLISVLDKLDNQLHVLSVLSKG
jgi:hypothetical protein